MTVAVQLCATLNRQHLSRSILFESDHRATKASETHRRIDIFVVSTHSVRLRLVMQSVYRGSIPKSEETRNHKIENGPVSAI